MAHRKKFTLKSSGPFKMMGSSSPIEQNIFNKDKPKTDLADTKIKQGIKRFFSDLKNVSKVDVPKKIVSDLDATSKKVSKTVKNFGTQVATDVSDLAKTDVPREFFNSVGSKIKAFGTKHQAWRDKRAKISAERRTKNLNNE